MTEVGQRARVPPQTSIALLPLAFLRPLENPSRRSKGAVAMWTFLTVVAGLVLTGLVLLDAFETVILPRAVTRGYRLTRLFYRVAWLTWRAVGLRLSAEGAARRRGRRP